MLSLFISEKEYKCRCCGAYPPDFKKGGELSIEYIMLFGYFDEIRTAYGRPIPISSGYRCPNNERRLYLENLTAKYPNLATNAKQRAAAACDPLITPFSAHVFGLALDLVVPTDMIKALVNVIEQETPKLRLGWRAYLDNSVPHVHIDTANLVLPRYSKNLRPGARW